MTTYWTLPEEHPACSLAAGNLQDLPAVVGLLTGPDRCEDFFSLPYILSDSRYFCWAEHRGEHYVADRDNRKTQGPPCAWVWRRMCGSRCQSLKDGWMIKGPGSSWSWVVLQ